MHAVTFIFFAHWKITPVATASVVAELNNRGNARRCSTLAASVAILRSTPQCVAHTRGGCDCMYQTVCGYGRCCPRFASVYLNCQELQTNKALFPAPVHLSCLILLFYSVIRKLNGKSP